MSLSLKYHHPYWFPKGYLCTVVCRIQWSLLLHSPELTIQIFVVALIVRSRFGLHLSIGYLMARTAQNTVELYAQHCLRTSISHDKLLLGAAVEAVKAQWESVKLKRNSVNNQLWISACGNDGILTRALKVMFQDGGVSCYDSFVCNRGRKYLNWCSRRIQFHRVHVGNSNVSDGYG